MTRPSLLGIVVAVLGTAAIAGLSRAPYRANPDENGVLRLSWRYQAPDAADCRRPTPEELEALPAHMRNPDACVSSPVPYGLTLTIDGQVVLDETIHAAGARQDRPIFVLRESVLPPGDHDVSVVFASRPEDDTVAPTTLGWSERLTVQPREIVLVGYDRESHALVRRGSDVVGER
jgi:hypothetical protein